MVGENHEHSSTSLFSISFQLMWVVLALGDRGRHGVRYQWVTLMLNSVQRSLTFVLDTLRTALGRPSDSRHLEGSVSHCAEQWARHFIFHR